MPGYSNHLAKDGNRAKQWKIDFSAVTESDDINILFYAALKLPFSAVNVCRSGL